MRWTQLATGLAVVLSATASLAETPYVSGDRTTAMSLMMRGPLYSGQNWWSRYGEAVNATAIAQASPSDNGVLAAPVPVYGDGYAFGPGSCDCPPPCIWQLWAGYYQNPHRCNGDGHWLHGRCGCGHCSACRGGCGCGQSSCPSCAAKAACGCGAPVACTNPVPTCGCKPVCGKCRHCQLGTWHGFSAHWTKCCNSCSLPVSCTSALPDYPPGAEKQSGDKVPSPLPDAAALHPLPRLK